MMCSLTQRSAMPEASACSAARRINAGSACSPACGKCTPSCIAPLPNRRRRRIVVPAVPDRQETPVGAAMRRRGRGTADPPRRLFSHGEDASPALRARRAGPADCDGRSRVPPRRRRGRRSRAARREIRSEPCDRQSAGPRDPARAGVPLRPRLSELSARRPLPVLKTALRMAGLPDRRSAPMARLRPVLRLAGRVSDGAVFLPVGAVPVAQPDAQGGRALSARTGVAPWCSVCRGRRRRDAACRLSELSRGSRRSRHRRLLAASVGLAGLLAASALAYMPLALLFGAMPWSAFGPFSFQLSRPLLYAVYFGAGIAFGANGVERGLFAPAGPLARRWPLWLVAALAGFLAWMALTALTIADQGKAPLWLRAADDLSFALACFANCFCVLALALRFLRRRSPLFETLTDNAYGMYLVHYVFVVWLQYALLGAALPAVVKAGAVFAGT